MTQSMELILVIDADREMCELYWEKAFVAGAPGIFNTDQGAQFTSSAFTDMLKEKKININMDGRGRCMDFRPQSVT